MQDEETKRLLERDASAKEFRTEDGSFTLKDNSLYHNGQWISGRVEVKHVKIWVSRPRIVRLLLIIGEDEEVLVDVPASLLRKPKRLVQLLVNKGLKVKDLTVTSLIATWLMWGEREIYQRCGMSSR